MKQFTGLLARFITKGAWWLIAGAIILSAVSLPGVGMLKTETGFASLVSTEAKIWQDNKRYESEFGGPAITILLSGELDDIFSSTNLQILIEFEDSLIKDARYRDIYSPLSILRTVAGNESQIDKSLIDSLIFDADGNVNPGIRSMIPDNHHVLMSIIPAGNMSDDELLKASQDIENFFNSNSLEKVEVTLVSDAKLIDAIAASLGKNMALLLVLAIIVMIVILFFTFRVRWRLLSLLIVGISALWTFGLTGYIGIPMSMATMAVLPILLGLGIDFSVQFHNRYQEELTRSADAKEAISISISNMFPVVGISLLATTASFITLYISEIPMIRDFGLVLSVGICFCFLAGLFLFHSIIFISDRKASAKKLQKHAKAAIGRPERLLLRMGSLVIKNTLWILVVAILFAVAGGIVDRWLPVNTDYEDLMPQNTPALVEMRQLRDITGRGGELVFLIEAEDVTDPVVMVWLKEYQEAAIANYPEILQVQSPAKIVTGVTGGFIPGKTELNFILNGIPEKESVRIISADRTKGLVIFSISYISMSEIHDLMQQLHEKAGQPDGVNISPVGTMAMGVSTIDTLIGARLTLNLICLGAIFVIIILAYRRLGKTVLTIIPVGAVIAWSSLDMYITGVPLNPLTAVLGVIVIGICTEFMVLLMGRYEEEKLLGNDPEKAMVTAISRIGRAIMITSLTTLGGFGVLIASDFVMIRDFGIATVIGVILCLIMTLTVMPGLIVWYDKRNTKKQVFHNTQTDNRPG